jgi:hypothetical protein
MQKIDSQKAYGERRRRDQLKIEQGLYGYATDHAQGASVGDAVHDGAEYDGTD